MPTYLVQVAYTSEAWGVQVDHPRDPRDRIGPVIHKLGGELQSMHYAFGEYDVVAIVEFPDNESAAALSLAARAGEAVSALKTTPLMSIEEGLSALRKADEAGYRPPGC